jgi:hypothetical protein
MAARAGLLIKQCFNAITNSKEPARIIHNDLYAQTKVSMVRAHMKYLSFFVYITEIN